MTNHQQHEQVRSGKEFIAALDQSGGSTPKALRLYGVDESRYATDQEMFDRIHEMRTRIITSPAFGGDRVIAAILFEDTMNRQVGGRNVMLKLTLPDEDDLYREFVDHSRVVRVVALSGGYSRAEANERLARNHGVIASFSRALTEGLRIDQTDEEFDAVLDTGIAGIHRASTT
jgi:fructose-bisphosphate aldolase class 1